MTNGIEEFLKLARECEKIAETMPVHRHALLEMAQAWRTAAAEQEVRGQEGAELTTFNRSTS
jgi:hypothetical protein